MARRLVMLALAALVMPDAAGAQAEGRRTLSPPSLPPARGYSHVVIAPAGRRAVISGQVSVDSVGAVVGVGDFRAQCIQAFENLGRALRSVGASFEDLASTLVRVVALYRPELMIEIAAEAVLPR